MTAQDFFQVVFWVAMYFMVLGITGYYFWEYGKLQAQRAKEYENLYSRIQKVINDWDVNENSYNAIYRLIDRLQKLKYKNNEMTSVLKDEFKDRYKPVSDAILNEEKMYCN